MNVVSGLDEAAVEGLVRSQATFEVIGLRGNFKAGIKMVETKIESLGMKCRVKSDTKSALAQGGAFWCGTRHIVCPCDDSRWRNRHGSLRRPCSVDLQP